MPEQPLPVLRLPELYKTTYEFNVLSVQHGLPHFQLRRAPRPNDGIPPPEPLEHASLKFTDLAEPDASKTPPENNNSAWARAQLSPVTVISWDGTETPSVQRAARSQPVPDSTDHIGKLVIFRSTFWQGAGSPFGTRPAWIAGSDTHQSRRPLTMYPSFPIQHTLSTKFPDVRVHTIHPIRPAKPTPGSRIYSRYIPHLNEFFSLWALDYKNDEHLGLFNQWQNDPRVAQGWNETGTLEQHCEYLHKIDEDSHQMAILAKFNDTFFSYHEIYWAKEDHVGAHYDADDYDRGRHSLVGDQRFRGKHRVMVWWCSIMHYMFLDEPRTKYIVGEPQFTNLAPLAYDHATGFNLEKLVDLPHKRSALVKCLREKFFHIAPFRFDGSDHLERNPFRTLKL